MDASLVLFGNFLREEQYGYGRETAITNFGGL